MVDRKVVVVTGASRGMGAAVACWLGTLGTTVAMIARDSERLSGVARRVERFGGRAVPLPGDIAEHESCARMVDQVLKAFGRLDALVNNAGILIPVARIADASPRAWLYNLEVNLMGPFNLTNASIPALRQSRGTVVNVVSGAALHPIEGWSAYCTSKAALLHFTRVLAAEEPHLTALSFRPGVVDTAMQELIRREGAKAMPPEKVAYFKRLKDEGQLSPPEVPSRNLAWLALFAPHSWSGELMDHDEPRVAQPALELFGSNLG